MLLYNKNSIYILELQNKMTSQWLYYLIMYTSKFQQVIAVLKKVTVFLKKEVTVIITELYYNSYRHPVHFST